MTQIQTRLIVAGVLLSIPGTALFAQWNEPASRLLLTTPAADRAQAVDTTFSTAYASGRPTTAKFYYNGRAIGAGREAFAHIVAQVARLPAGTSIVWGPDYSRCGACSGAEPPCIPRFLYPDLWRKLEATAGQRRLVLSSNYPGPWPDGAQGSSRAMPAAINVNDPAANGRFSAVLDWQIVARESDQDRYGSVWHRFSFKGKELSRYDLDHFFGRLPMQARVLVRIAFDKTISEKQPQEHPPEITRGIRRSWSDNLADPIRLGNLQATLTAPPGLAEELRRVANTPPLAIRWNNFHGPNTPHEEVVYLLNDHYVGRGQTGFARILANIDRLSMGTEIVLPRYELGGRMATEWFSDEALAAENAKLAKVVPYAAKRAELDALIAKRKLTVTFFRIMPDYDDTPHTVIDWGGGDRYGETFVSFGRIVRHDEQRRPAASRLSWSRYDSRKAAKERHSETTPLESEASYTWNDIAVGRGTAGFAKAMEQVAKLPAGSVVDVRVCLRTKAPFLCPIVYQGHRHFERTGYEPYAGMLPWLVDLAHRRRLEVRWVPDEQASCGDCQRNL